MLTDAPLISFIPARDLAAARAFYVDALGLEVVRDSPAALVLDAAGTQIFLTAVSEFTPQPFTVAGWAVRELDAVMSGLREHGVTFLVYEGFGQDDAGVWTTPGGDRIVWFEDPFGNNLSMTEFA